MLQQTLNEIVRRHETSDKLRACLGNARRLREPMAFAL